MSQAVVALTAIKVDLGSVDDFAILSKAQITDIPTSNVTGDVGASPINGASIHLTCAEVDGTVYAVDATGPAPCSVNDASLLSTAIGDMGTAYTNASGQTAGVGAFLNVGTGTLTDQTLVPGVYTWDTAVTIPTNLTLDCQSDADAVFVFQIAGTLTIASAKQVVLINSCQASNIFWAITGATTLGTYSTFNGNILTTGTSYIALQTGATLNGRALSDGEVTLDAATVSVPVESTDIISPVVTSVSPAANAWNTNVTPAFTFNYTDASSATASCTLFVAGVPRGTNSSVINKTNTIITSNSSLSQGSNSWNVNCTDLSGNSGVSVSRAVNIDTGTPIVSSVSPATNVWTTTAAPAFTFNYADALSSTSSCTLFVAGAPMGTNSSAVNNTTTTITANASLSQGSNSWYVNCSDLAGNSGASTARVIKVDTSNPAVLSVSPATNVWTASATPAFTFNYTDVASATASCTLFVAGVPRGTNALVANSTNTAITANASLSQGSNSWNVNCTDLSGNSGVSASRAVIIDTVAPVVTSVSPATSTWSTSATPAFTFNYTDALSSTASCTLFAAGVPVGANSSVINRTNTAITANASLSQGSNSWYVNCTDLAGNVGNATARTVLVDSVKPVSSINNINGVNNTNSTNNATLTINFTASDTNIKNWTLSVYNSTWGLKQSWTENTANISSIKTYTAVTNGTYRVNLSVWDNATNVNTTTFSVIVDQAAPAVNRISTSSVTNSSATLLSMQPTRPGYATALTLALEAAAWLQAADYTLPA
ncbi:MAG: ice-binding family protein [Candidatus Micrarchaeia archaeon]